MSTIAVCRIVRDRSCRSHGTSIRFSLRQYESNAVILFVMDRTDSVVLNTPYDFFLREMSHL